MKRELILFISDILDNIKDIGSFSRGLSKEEFKTNKLKQNAIIRSLEVIGEATKNIPDSFRKKYPEVEWKKIAGFRDILIHAYFGITLERVWNVIKEDMPAIKEKIKNIKTELENEAADKKNPKTQNL